MASAYSNASLDPLPDDIRNGMIAMGLFGLVSTISTFTLMSFITYRMIYWKRYYDQPIHKNQVFVLIYNLLLADFQQALSFLISFHWLAQGKLVGPNTQCFAQGWLIQIGDMSSGLWVLSIAVHTFVSLVGQKQIRHRTFVACVISLWTFCLFLTAIGPLLSKDDFFVPAGAWCWISDTHESERLYLHYLWIFISQLGSLVIYISLFFFLRGRLSNGPLSNPSLSSNSQDPTSNMVYYPFAYVALTLPLASARVASMAGRTPPLVFFPVAGSLMACCGAIDVILYISTRKALVKSSVGMIGSGYSENTNALRRFRTGEEERQQRERSIRMNRMESDVGVANSASQGKKGFGDIVVSQTVVMSEEGSVEEGRSPGGAGGDGRSERSDSLRSLVRRKDEEQEDFERQQKSWLA
ncbi:uncharacterized protein LY89DRAFT_761129 [Mollisia scopiformis]|uniref:Glucose receptor Git3-like N-terminal domain-containing protein n=1 Tax=Mollisia scopiformis TaxID=149040 RepID=A0A132BB96_MOLSC|nr:uncharacterized protein LY89DRAFT_761129 [Mollisia scopiformis]KUJ09543.1 hypothetical protein LY89DRAFT_761129 [Mollisia scopiformis]